MIALAPQYTQRSYFWTAWKAVETIKGGQVQYDDDGAVYVIWFYDGPEVHLCTIWKGEVPDGITQGGYTQEQNDTDKADFEANIQPTANRPLAPKAVSGVRGQAPAKGLGGFAPDPTNNPYQPSPDEVVSLYVDGEGSLVTRGAALTDEGSLRDDFSGTSLETDITGTLTFTNGSNLVTGTGTLFTSEINRDHYVKLTSDDGDKWAAIVRAPRDGMLQLDGPYTGTSGTGTAQKTRWIQIPEGDTPGTLTVGGSHCTLSSGTAADSGIRMWRDGDYLPMIGTWRVSITQRIVGQETYFGFRDSSVDPRMYCDVILDGTDDTTIKFRSAWDQDDQVTVVTLPGLVTSNILRYKIDVSTDYCSLMINGVLVARHDNHVPDMYSMMTLCAGILNTEAVTNTDLVIDTLFWSNQDQLQVSSIFQAPIPVITREDQHSLASKLVTNETTADQVMISYEVPAGKVCHIIGYRLDGSGPVAGVVKIGRNDVSTEVSAPGVLDGNIFRSLYLGPNGDFVGEFGANPRRIGVGGDTLLVTVTPDEATTNTWRVYLDFVLR